MASNHESPRQQTYKRVKQGDPVSASEWNKITRETSRLTGAPNQNPKKPVRAIKLMRLIDNIGQFGVGYSSQAHRRDGVVQYYDETINDFVPTSNTETKTNITDACKLIHDRDEYVWAMYSEQSGLWHPINPRSVRHAITVQEEDSNGGTFYPTCPDGNVFAIKFVRIEYTKYAGQQPYTAVNMGGDGGLDDHVLNIFVGDESLGQTSWIPEGTLIVCYNLFGYWYTYTCCYTCPESSSSSESSISSQSEISSESSSSDSSGSESSQSQTSASSTSISSDSSLSASSSSSGGSSVSVSGSSGYTCAQFVTDVTFNEETCQLTVNYGCLCWPDELGITFTPSECAG